jgi:acylphosphatase
LGGGKIADDPPACKRGRRPGGLQFVDAANDPCKLAEIELESWAPMGQKRIHLIVRGRVQDVFFRASTQREARRLGLTGWVRNRPDGAVELVAEGEEDQVKDLLAWAQHGPATARVDKVDTRWRSYTGEFADFRIMTE